MRHREANGEIVDVPVDDLFFSATNIKGIISETNDVFVNISRFSRDELLGKPHNIVRHPDMPGGSFREMWYRLHDGKSFGGYFRNLTPEGATFDVYATVTPIPGSTDFLSVRQRCCHNDNFDMSLRLFKQIRDKEYGWMAEGLGTNDVIERGRDYMLKILPDYGFEDYDAYQNAMLPWEVYCREGMSAGLPERPNAPRLDAAHTIHHELDKWMGTLEHLLETTRQVSSAKDQMLATIAHASEVESNLGKVALNSTELQVLSFQLHVWISMHSIVEEYVEDAVAALERVSRSSLTSRFDISAARLHATMLATFIAEIIDGRGNADDHERQLQMLRRVLRHSVSIIDRSTFDRNQLIRRAASKLRSLVEIMSSPMQLLADAIAQAVSVQQLEIVESVRKIHDAASAASTQMSELAARLEGDQLLMDVENIYRELDKLAIEFHQ